MLFFFLMMKASELTVKLWHHLVFDFQFLIFSLIQKFKYWEETLFIMRCYVLKFRYLLPKYKPFVSCDKIKMFQTTITSSAYGSTTACIIHRNT